MRLVRRLTARLSPEQYGVIRRGANLFEMSLSDFVRTPAVVMAMRDPRTGTYLSKAHEALAAEGRDSQTETYVCNLREEHHGSDLAISISGKLMDTSVPARQYLLPGRERRVKRRDAVLSWLGSESTGER